MILYEDGFVSNICNDIKNISWNDIIDLDYINRGDEYDEYLIALHSNGRVSFEILVNDNLVSNEWMNPIKSWEKIVAIDHGYVNLVEQGGMTYTDEAILGFRVDGKVEIIDSSGKRYTADYSVVMEEMDNVMNSNSWLISNKRINDQGQMIHNYTQMPILSDIIYYRNGLAVSRSGNLFDAGHNQISGVKVCVYEEIGIFKDYWEGLQ